MDTMRNVNHVTITGRVAQPPRRVADGYVFSLFQEQSFGSDAETQSIYPVIFGWGRPPSFLRVNQAVLVIGKVRSRNFRQSLRRLVIRALQREAQHARAAQVASLLPASLGEPRVAIEIVADHIAIINESGGEQ